MKSTKIFLITKDGPEWSVPIEAWTSRTKAERRIPDLNSSLDKNNVYDSLSEYSVTEVILKD